MRFLTVSHSFSHTLATTLLRAALALSAAAAPSLFLAAAPAAHAQEVAPVKQYWVVPQTEDVKLRCHHGNLWYPITSVGTNTTLLVDGEIDGWLRVTYPPGTPVVVRSTEAELSADRTMVKLTRKPRLRAFNKENQFLEECYKSVVLDEAPNPGTELRYLQSVKTRAGEVGGYLVEAPAGSKGFVLSTDVRRATNEEIQRAAGTVPAPSNPPAPQTATAPEPAPVTTPAPVENKPSAEPVVTRPEPKPEPAPVTTPAPEPVVTTPPPAVTTTPPPAEPAPSVTPAPPTSTPAETIEMKPAQPEPTTPGNVDILVPVDQPAPQPKNDIDPAASFTPAPPANTVATQPRGPMTLEQLDRAFDQLNAEPIDSAEFEPLISEYQRFLATVPDDRSNKRMRAYIDARIQILQMKQGVQKSNSELASIRSQATNVDAEARASAERIERTRDYLVVGRLQPSTVYDGKRLPLLYRVQAAEGGRTLAYVAPEPSSLGLDSKLGMIVGVKGKGSLDPSARVTIVQATAVDILQTGPDGSYVPVNPAPVEPTYIPPPPANFTPPANRNYSNLNPPASTPPATTTPSSPGMLPPRRAPDYGSK